MNNRRRGAVLIFVLWATAALATVGVAQATRLSLQVRFTSQSWEREQAWYLAWTGVQSVSQLLAQDDPAYDAWKERWAQSPAEPIPFGVGSFLTHVRDEQATLPLNVLGADLLLRLPGFTEAACQTLLTRRSEGKTITHPAQLLTLPGFDAAALPDLLPWVTVHGVGPVNLNTASREVLEKLGFSGLLLEAVERFRNGADGMVGTEDDSVFEKTGLEEISQKLRTAVGYTLTPEDSTFLNGFLQGEKPLLGVASGLFRVETEGQTARGGGRVRAEAVVDRNGTVRGWHES